jgi:hypothetical protein
MCEGHHHEGRGHGHGPGRGFRGFGRRGFPNREQLVERLQGYQQHLEGELKNVQELQERLGDAPEAPAEA